jgi:hypothetical protein
VTAAIPEAVGAAEAGTAAVAGTAAKKAAAKKTATKRPARKPADPKPGQGTRTTTATGQPAAGDGTSPDALTRYRSGRRKARSVRREVSGSLPRPGLKGSSSRRVLVGEFIACSAVIALSPVSGRHDKDTPADWLRRTSGLALLFLVLGLVATAGPKASRVASALGGLVTLALLVSERDVLVVLAGRFNGPAASGVPTESLGDTDSGRAGAVLPGRGGAVLPGRGGAVLPGRGAGRVPGHIGDTTPAPTGDGSARPV